MPMEDLISTLAAITNDKGAHDLELTVEIESSLAGALMRHGQLSEAASMLSRMANRALPGALKTQIADQLLLLARAMSKSGDSELAARSESILRLTLELEPAKGVAPLAHYLQQEGRLDEAVELWNDAIRHNPQEAGNYLALAKLYKQMGKADKALASCLDLISVAPSARNTLMAAGLLDELVPLLPKATPSQTVRVALLGNTTLDHLGRYLKVQLYRAAMRPEIYLGNFGQYTQEILDPTSGLYSFSPDVVILAIHPSCLFPNLHNFPFDMTIEQRRAEIDTGLEAIQKLLTAFTQRSSALLLMHNMVVPQHPALSVLDLRDELGQIAVFQEINLRLAEMVRSQFKNVYIVDEDRIQSRHGKGQATDARMWLTARLAWCDALLNALSQEYLRFVYPLKGLNRKCIVLDLDNTLWGGVVGEDGLAGIQISPDAPGNAYVAFQRELERLWKRGVLLAISSKNNPEDALAVFEKHPDMVLRLSHFATHRINWEPKESNIRDIATELNIGLDSLVFLDDNPVERAKVRTALPDVLTPEMPADPALYRATLLGLGVFDTLAFTQDDRDRNTLYVEQKARHEYKSALGNSNSSLEEYLTGLEMVVTVAPADNMSLPRIAQLTNKTNQFNLTTRRYSEAQIIEMQARGSLIFTMKVKDRFGDNGLVGVSIVTPKSTTLWEIDTFLMSCRVMGRNVETALLAVINGHLRERGVTQVEGWYIPTAKNAPVKDFYPRHGFTQSEEQSDSSILYSFDLKDGEVEVPRWIDLRISVSV